jgi:hypothetical protein
MKERMEVRMDDAAIGDVIDDVIDVIGAWMFE